MSSPFLSAWLEPFEPGQRIVRQAFKHTRDAKDDAPTIVVKVGGFLGLGGRLVAIPGGKWVQSRGTIVLGMTAADIAKLPTWEPRPSGEFVGKK